jgi:hypothetical protein
MLYLIPFATLAVLMPARLWANRSPESYRAARPSILYATSVGFAVLGFFEHMPVPLISSLLFALAAADESRRIRLPKN